MRHILCVCMAAYTQSVIECHRLLANLPFLLISLLDNAL